MEQAEGFPIQAIFTLAREAPASLYACQLSLTVMVEFAA